eukprot:TRINITY_DN4050_c1_g1_i1.p1 TRINITY_DN4050_c1_g1~~TRINITY_DN4050_c1_g1_i1.p1  ORF type:complete len:163 (+),score=7.50 TRINITY_DN4050_c1_g1_i1:61-549(+)
MKILSSEIYGEWRDNPPCSCNKGDVEVVGVQFLTVPFVPVVLRVLWEFFRAVVFLVTLGASDIVCGGLKDHTHDCILCTAKCRNCNQSQTFLAEFNSSGKQIRPGMYGNVIFTSGEVPISCTVSDMLHTFDETPNPPYSLLFFNCSHWSSAFFSRLMQFHDG